MAFAVGGVWEETRQALGEAVDFEALFATVVGALTMYCILLVVPELASKGVAAVLTAGLIGYLGVDAVWSLFAGWRRLMEEVEEADSFLQVRAAGERFGRVMGRNAARAFVLLVTVALGNTAAGFAARAPTLPGAGRAMGLAGAGGGVGLGAVAAVETVAITAEGASLTLAPRVVTLKGRKQGGGDSPGEPGSPGQRSWESSSGLRKALGPAGEGKEWHHLVEQTPGNTQRFGPRAIHNTENVIPLEKKLHTEVSAFYSSIQEDITGSMTLTVRKWLSTQSYEAQRTFGLRTIENVRRGVWGVRK